MPPVGAAIRAAVARDVGRSEASYRGLIVACDFTSPRADGGARRVLLGTIRLFQARSQLRHIHIALHCVPTTPGSEG